MNPYELLCEIITVLENSDSTIDDIAQFTNDIYAAQKLLANLRTLIEHGDPQLSVREIVLREVFG